MAIYILTDSTADFTPEEAERRGIWVVSLKVQFGEETMACLFNFSGRTQTVRLNGVEGEFTDLISGETACCPSGTLEPYQYRLCLGGTSGR